MFHQLCTDYINIDDCEDIYEKPLLKTFAICIDDNLKINIYINDEKYYCFYNYIGFSFNLQTISEYIDVKKCVINTICHTNINDLFTIYPTNNILFDGYSETFNIFDFPRRIVSFSTKYIDNVNILKNKYIKFYISYSNIRMNLFTFWSRPCDKSISILYLREFFSYPFLIRNICIKLYSNNTNKNIDINKNEYFTSDNSHNSYSLDFNSHNSDNSCSLDFNSDNSNNSDNSYSLDFNSDNSYRLDFNPYNLNGLNGLNSLVNSDMFNKNYEQYNNTIFTISATHNIDFKCILNILRTTDSYLIVITPLKIIDNSTYYEIDFFSGKSSNCKECNKFTKFHKNFNNYYSRLCYLCKNHNIDLKKKLSYLIDQKSKFSDNMNNINELEVNIDKNELLLKLKNILNIDITDISNIYIND